MTLILDTTLRDGSYVLDFQFSGQNTRDISVALANFGFDFIEIGHGLGLGAYRKNANPIYTDEDHLKAASENLGEANWGMFFIPGIGDFADIDKAHEYGMKFIRIGVNANQTDKALDYIRYAKEKGFWVAANFMKTYGIEADDFAKRAVTCQTAGADLVCVVDSAGGMMPEDVERYFKSVEGKVPLGYHGHDNLRMAIANTLKAIECGAVVVDTSLQGLGRDAGNASTEVLVAILQKRGMAKQIDLIGLLDFSKEFIHPLYREVGISDISLVSGAALFHSSYHQMVERVAEQYELDIRDLIIGLADVNVLDPSVEQVEILAKSLSSKEKINQIHTSQSYQVHREGGAGDKAMYEVARNARALASRCNKPTVLNIVLSEQNEYSTSPFLQETEQFIIASCKLTSANQLRETLQISEQRFDYYMLDIDSHKAAAAAVLAAAEQDIAKEKLLKYCDSEVWAKAIADVVIERATMTSRICILGQNIPATILKDQLSLVGLTVSENLDHDSIELLISFDLEAIALQGKSLCDKLSDDAIVIDGLIGALSADFIEAANARNIPVMRTDMRPALNSAVLAKINSKKLINNAQGCIVIEGQACVAGGLYGNAGDVVIDSVEKPKTVLGIADGYGGVQYQLDEQQQQVVGQVERAIFGRGNG